MFFVVVFFVVVVVLFFLFACFVCFVRLFFSNTVQTFFKRYKERDSVENKTRIGRKLTDQRDDRILFRIVKQH